MYKIKLKNKKKNSYSVVVIKINKKINSNKIVEILGSYDFLNKKLVINIFRLIFWISKDVIICGKFIKLLYLFDIFEKKI